VQITAIGINKSKTVSKQTMLTLGESVDAVEICRA